MLYLNQATFRSGQPGYTLVSAQKSEDRTSFMPIILEVVPLEHFEN